MKCAFILSTIMLLSSCSRGYKILIYAPKVFYSHVRYMGRIADVLVEVGHDVTVLLAEYNEEILTNGTMVARMIHANGHLDKSVERINFFDNAWSTNTLQMDHLFHLATALSNTESIICKRLLADFGLLKRLKDERFDLGISETLTFCGFGLFEKIALHKHVSAFNTEIIETLTEPFGISYNPSYVPAVFSHSDDMMNFAERIENFAIFISTYVFARYIAIPFALKPLEQHIRRPYKLAESIETLAKCPFVFINTNGLLEFPREQNSKVVFINAINLLQPNPLNEEFQHLMDASTGGVVLVSFGSIAISSQMPPNFKIAFVNTFRRFPKVTFIWKYEVDDEVASDLSNVIKMKWVPQVSLLGHRNMRAFVSHCGANAVGETLRAGIPMVCIPLFFDQMRGAKKMQRQRAAMIIHKHNFTAESLQLALRTVLYDKSYMMSTRRISAITSDVLLPAKEEISRRIRIAVRLTNVMKLDPIGRRLNYLQYFFVDIIAVLIVPIVIFY